MSNVQDTWVYRRKIGTLLWYLSIQSQESRVGRRWQHGLTSKMQDAWRGPLPASPRMIITNLGVSLNLHEWERVDVRVTTETNFELGGNDNG